MATNCILKSVTLAPNESYVFPGGSQVAFVSNSSAITAQNDCLNIPETISNCYVLPFSTALRGSYYYRSLANTDEYDSSNISQVDVIGLVVNNEFYEFSSSFTMANEFFAIGWNDGSSNVANPANLTRSYFRMRYLELFGFMEFFDAKHVASSIGATSNTAPYMNWDGLTGNHTIFYHIKIPKEIGDNLKLRVRGQVRARRNRGAGASETQGANSSALVEFDFPAVPAADFDFTDLPVELSPCTND